MMSRPALYAYGVASAGAEDEDDALALRLCGSGIGGQDVLVVRGEGFVALAGPVEVEEVYVPRPRDLAAHHQVLLAAMQERDVVPFRFGTIVQDRGELEAVLARGGRELLSALARVKGKEEAVVKAYWKQEAVRREIERELGDIGRLEERAQGEGARRLLAIEVGQRIEACLERWKVSHVKRVCDALGLLAADLRLHEPVGVRMILNAAFLVDRERRADFAAAVRQVEETYAELLEFRCLLGVPPYSFADFTLRLA